MGIRTKTKLLYFFFMKIDLALNMQLRYACAINEYIFFQTSKYLLLFEIAVSGKDTVDFAG